MSAAILRALNITVAAANAGFYAGNHRPINLAAAVLSGLCAIAFRPED
jgi:hypothetical protein